MGSRVCKTVKVTEPSRILEGSGSTSRTSSDATLIEVKWTGNEGTGASGTENPLPLPIFPNRQSPVENEDTSQILERRHSSGTIEDSPRNTKDYFESDQYTKQKQDDKQLNVRINDNSDERAGITHPEDERTDSESAIVHPEDESQNSSGAIIRENEAVQEKGDPGGEDTFGNCYNTNNRLSSPATANVPEIIDDNVGVNDDVVEDARRGQDDGGNNTVFNLFVDNRAIRLKGVVEKCCESYTKDDSVFVNVPAYEKAKEHLLKYHYLTLTGKPGEGKTLLARHLLLDIVRNKDKSIRLDEVILACTPDDWKDHINLSKRQFVLIEDIFGTSNLSRERLDMWRPYLDTMCRLVNEQKGKLCVVITSRRHILEEARNLHKDSPFLAEADIINLTDYILSPDVRKEILLKHVNDLAETDIQRIINCDVPHGFPYCCKAFSAIPHFRNKGSRFFYNPTEYIREGVDCLNKTDVVKYSALVICMLNDGQIRKIDLDFTQLDESGKQRLKTILEITEVPAETSTRSLIEALDNLTCLYLQKHNDGYRFMHPCLLEAVAESCAEYIPGAIVKLCSQSFLHERVRISTGTEKHGDSYVLLLKPHEYKTLAARFYEEVKEKRIKSVVQHQACQLRDNKFVDCFASFLEEHNLFTEIVSHCDMSMRSILYWCAWAGIEKLFFFILRGIKTENIAKDYLDSQKSMCLVAASFFGHEGIVRQLLESMTEVNFHDKVIDRRTNIKYEMFGFFLGRLMYIQPTPLHAAVCGGHVAIVDKLLYYQANVNAKDQEGGTPLHIAACSGNVDIVKRLIQKGADVNARDVYRRSPLHIASGVPYIHNIVPKSFHLEKMTCVREKNPKIRRQNQILIAKDLINHGSCVNNTDCYGDTPLHSALSEHNFHMAEIFISSKYEANIQNGHGRSALHIAAQLGQTDICELLVKHGADVNTVNRMDKSTPIHRAVFSGDTHTVKYLVSCGADINCRDDTNTTPLEIARRSQLSEIIQLLETVGPP